MANNTGANYRTEGPLPPPTVDPTIATHDSITRAVVAERDFVNGKIEIINARLNAMDEATKVLSESINRTPTLLQSSIQGFGELVNEKFKAVNEKFAEVAAVRNEKFASFQDKFETMEKTRLEQKQDSKIGVDAALSAQKESAVTQDINNQKAIDKSEKATSEIIKNNQDANKASIDILTKAVDELKTEVSKIVATKQGANENRAGLYAAIGVVGVILGIITVVANAIFH